MSAETRDLIQWMVITAVGLATLIGIFVQIVIKPWIQSQLVQPLAETRHGVLINGGVSDPPTLRDDLGELRDGLEELRDEFRAVSREIRRDIGGLREENRTERAERRAGDRRIEEQLQRLDMIEISLRSDGQP